MTRLKAKVTNALNETRMLIVGAQILLGFQRNGVVQARCEHLAHHALWVDLAGRALMSAAVAFLIAPAPFHRLTESGRDTARLHAFTTLMAELALFPFGLCIGIDTFIVTELLFGTLPSIIAGAAFTATAALFWYGLEVARRGRKGGTLVNRHEDDEAPETDLSERINTLLIEARVILPGAQALLGFQFPAFLTNGFEQIPQRANLVPLRPLPCVPLTPLPPTAPPP